MAHQSPSNATHALVMLKKLLAPKNNVAFMEFPIDLSQPSPAIAHLILFLFVRGMEGLILRLALQNVWVFMRLNLNLDRVKVKIRAKIMTVLVERLAFQREMFACQTCTILVLSIDAVSRKKFKLLKKNNSP
jgi:hypothetical protein